MQRENDLQEHVPRGFLAHSSPLLRGGRQVIQETRALDELHDDVQRSGLVEGLVIAHDVRMRQPREDVDLARDASDRSRDLLRGRPEPRRFLLRVQRLHRTHRALASLFVNSVHAPERARAEKLLEDVPANDLFLGADASDAVDVLQRLPRRPHRVRSELAPARRERTVHLHVGLVVPDVYERGEQRGREQALENLPIPLDAEQVPHRSKRVRLDLVQRPRTLICAAVARGRRRRRRRRVRVSEKPSEEVHAVALPNLRAAFVVGRQLRERAAQQTRHRGRRDGRHPAARRFVFSP
eukprot:17224-Pelagococcus_subviridis.AAC.5